MTGTRKCQFARLNDKRYYFLDGNISFPFVHFYLTDIKDFKIEAKEETQKTIMEKN